MIVHLNLPALRDTHWYEYLIRFVLGGAMIVITGLMAVRLGPIAGGLFLAFPAIFPASRDACREACAATQRESGLVRSAAWQRSGCAECHWSDAL